MLLPLPIAALALCYAADADHLGSATNRTLPIAGRALTAEAEVGGATTKYGLVFDAGSSGTRVHVYRWRAGGGGPKDAFDLVSDDLLKIKPGLSAHKAKTAEAGASLRPLLAFAKSKVPAALVAQTPVLLMATAGLRLVGEAAKDRILGSVRRELQASGFLFRGKWAALLSGQEEGLFGWVTVNYLLETLYPPAPKPPVGILDLGGGSVQVVFEVQMSQVIQGLELQGASRPKVALKRLDFGGRTHDAYVQSHLGFGLDEARRRTLAIVLGAHTIADKELLHPCAPKGARVEHERVTVAGDGDWQRCLELVSKLFVAPEWSLEGMPPLPAHFYGFSYLYDRTAAIGLLDGDPQAFGQAEMTIDQIAEAGQKLCALDANQTAARFASTQDADKAHNFCGDVAYIAALLDHLGISASRPLVMTNKINGVELVWTLGAMLAKSAELQAGGAGELQEGGRGEPSLRLGPGGLILLVLMVLFIALFSLTAPLSRRDIRDLGRTKQ